MIREDDLLDAIAECQGSRNPNAQTCIKLAAYYTILDNIRKPDNHTQQPIPFIPDYSYSYKSDTEFGKLIEEKAPDEIFPIMDELMTALKVLHPKLYNATINKLTGGLD